MCIQRIFFLCRIVLHSSVQIKTLHNIFSYFLLIIWLNSTYKIHIYIKLELQELHSNHPQHAAAAKYYISFKVNTLNIST